MSGELPLAVVAISLPAEAEAELQQHARIERVDPRDGGALKNALERAEGLLCSPLLKLGAGLLDAAPRLRVVSNFGVGFDNVELEDATRRGIAVCNTPRVLSEAVADLTMALILSAARNMSANAAFAREGGWSRREAAPPLGFDLEEKTLGLVGFGRIGREVARRARAFRMRVLYHDIEPALGEWTFCAPRELQQLLMESDIVSLHVDLNEKTRHMIGAKELNFMQPPAWLINTSRGAVVDQEALVSALQRGRIAGAALDVLETEPPAPDDPILSFPNVILLPHVGSATVETREAMMEMAVRNLWAVLSGDRPSSCVNPESLRTALKPR